MGLRTVEGIDLNRLESQFSASLNRNKIKELEELSLISVDQNALRATDQGRPVLNGILREILPD
jgi:oxygen-independent coproporphyrinogen-3 oxidase